MTEQRHLKRLVRDRMAHTGETYTTARRQILAKAGRVAGAATLPAGLVPGYDVFGGGQHRESTLVAHMLRQAGYVAPHTGEPYTEAMVCGLAGGIGFMYAVFEYTSVPPMVTIVAQHHPEPWLPAALGKLGISYTEQHSAKPEPALVALRRALDGGRAVLCAVDSTQLPWRAGQLGMSQDPCQAVVVGYADGTLYVEDTGDAPWSIGEAQFAAAWSGHKKGRHQRVVVTPGAEVDLHAALRAAIATTVAHLTGPVLGNYFDGNFGFSGMGRLADALRDDRARTGWLKRFADPGAFATVIPRLHDCLEVQYTAPGATRPLYADFLDEAAVVLADDRIAEAARMFRESGEIWSRLAATAAETGDSLGELAELAARRMRVVITKGAAGRDEIRALSAEIEALGRRLPPKEERRALFDECADLVDAAREAEQRAVDLLDAV